MNHLHGKRAARRRGTFANSPLSRVRPRVEVLEDRLVLDVGDTLAAATVTGIGPGPGRYTMYAEALGDGSFAARDVDLYRFQAGVNTILTARSSPAAFGAAMDPLLRLFNASGAELEMNDTYLTSRYGQLSYTFTAVGMYYLGVSGSPNATYDPAAGGSGAIAEDQGIYGLEIQLANAPAILPDAGDDIINSAWTDVYGYYTSNGYYQTNSRIGDGPYGAHDVDMYLFYAAAGTTITARTLLPYPGAASVDTYLRLFDGNGVELAVSDDGPFEYGLYSYLTFTIPVEAYYAIGVSGYGNSGYDPYLADSGTDGETGLYRFELFLNEASYDPLPDVGDSFLTTAEYMAAGYYQIVQTLGDGPFGTRDVDMVIIDAAAGATLLARTSRPPAGAYADTFLRLFDDSGFELAVNDDGSTENYSALSYRFAAGGIYFLGVSSFPNYVYRGFEEGSGVPGGGGQYVLDMFLFSGGPSPGPQGNGSDLVNGLGSDPAEGLTPIVGPGTPARPLPVAEEAAIDSTTALPALLVEAQGTTRVRVAPAGLTPDQRFVLDLVFGAELEW